MPNQSRKQSLSQSFRNLLPKKRSKKEHRHRDYKQPAKLQSQEEKKRYQTPITTNKDRVSRSLPPLQLDKLDNNQQSISAGDDNDLAGSLDSTVNNNFILPVDVSCKVSEIFSDVTGLESVNMGNYGYQGLSNSRYSKQIKFFEHYPITHKPYHDAETGQQFPQQTHTNDDTTTRADSHEKTLNRRSKSFNPKTFRRLQNKMSSFLHQPMFSPRRRADTGPQDKQNCQSSQEETVEPVTDVENLFRK